MAENVCWVKMGFDCPYFLGGPHSNLEDCPGYGEDAPCRRRPSLLQKKLRKLTANPASKVEETKSEPGRSGSVGGGKS